MSADLWGFVDLSRLLGDMVLVQSTASPDVRRGSRFSQWLHGLRYQVLLLGHEPGVLSPLTEVGTLHPREDLSRSVQNLSRRTMISFELEMRLYFLFLNSMMLPLLSFRSIVGCTCHDLR